MSYEMSHENNSKWTSEDMYLLYEYMAGNNPFFQSDSSRDPFVIAQDFQRTIDGTPDPDFRKIMGDQGAEQLNSLAENRLTYKHLMIITSRLLVLHEEDGEPIVDDISRRGNLLITGMFDRFTFEESAASELVQEDMLTVKIERPEFLYAKSRKIAIDLFDANKNLVSISSGSELTIPVADVRGHVYNPEKFLERD